MKRYPGRTVLGILGTVVLFLGTTGCNTLPGTDIPVGRSYRATNVGRVDHIPADIRRVAILPAWCAHPSGETTVAAIDEAFVYSFTRSARFEIIPITRDQLQLWTGSTPVSVTEPLPASLFAEVRARTAADAVLLADITHFSPYPPLALGLRARLVRLDNGKELWLSDELFDARDPRVLSGARRYQARGATSPVDLSHTVLQSPARFARYAVETLATTLPPR